MPPPFHSLIDEEASRQAAEAGRRLYDADILRNRYLDYIASIGASSAGSRQRIVT